MQKACLFSQAGFAIMVRLAGIEPTTPWFVAKYSIQLSYSRVEDVIVAQYLAVLASFAKKVEKPHFFLLFLRKRLKKAIAERP